MKIYKTYSLAELEEAYKTEGSYEKAGKKLNISKTAFRQQLFFQKKLCIKCTKHLDREGVFCSECLSESFLKTKQNLPEKKSCIQCGTLLVRAVTQSNISWSKQQTCKDCEYSNKLEGLKKHYLKNREKYLDKDRKRKVYHKQYRQSENGKLRRRISNSKRKAQKQTTCVEKNINKYIMDLFITFKICYYCGSADNLTVEHKIPLSRGGAHTKDNITLACARCNMSKGSKTVEEYLKYKEI